MKTGVKFALDSGSRCTPITIGTFNNDAKRSKGRLDPCPCLNKWATTGKAIPG
jgi:hypothetical protein